MVEPIGAGRELVLMANRRFHAGLLRSVLTVPSPHCITMRRIVRSVLTVAVATTLSVVIVHSAMIPARGGSG
jgi:hypothetical protein